MVKFEERAIGGQNQVPDVCDNMQASQAASLKWWVHRKVIFFLINTAGRDSKGADPENEIEMYCSIHLFLVMFMY